MHNKECINGSEMTVQIRLKLSNKCFSEIWRQSCCDLKNQTILSIGVGMFPFMQADDVFVSVCIWAADLWTSWCLLIYDLNISAWTSIKQDKTEHYVIESLETHIFLKCSHFSFWVTQKDWCTLLRPAGRTLVSLSYLVYTKPINQFQPVAAHHWPGPTRSSLTF